MFNKKKKRLKAVHGAAQNELTGVERTFGKDDLIVTKTDLKGHIVYTNRLFCDLAGYTEEELLGAPHNIIRHPHMPRCIFKLLWDTISSGKEIFAYVVNRSRNGDHYWVVAHVTPSFDSAGRINGYHSNRRVANPALIKDVITPLYQKLKKEEDRHDNPKAAAAAGVAMLTNMLEEKGQRYDEFIFALLH